jgi:hypothetical protein
MTARLTASVTPTAAWIAAHRGCDHFDGRCAHGNVDFVPQTADSATLCPHGVNRRYVDCGACGDY